MEKIVQFTKNIDKRVWVGLSLALLTVGTIYTYKYIRFRANASAAKVL